MERLGKIYRDNDRLTSDKISFFRSQIRLRRKIIRLLNKQGRDGFFRRIIRLLMRKKREEKEEEKRILSFKNEIMEIKFFIISLKHDVYYHEKGFGGS